MYSVVDIAGHQPDLGADPRQRRRRDRGHGRRRRRRPLADRRGRWSARRCSASRRRASTAARERLEELGYEVLVFHATGTGGQAMEALATRRLPRRRARRHDDRAGRRARRRRARRRARTGWRPPAERASRRSCRSARSTWSTSAPRDTVPERFARPQVLRAQPDGDADAHDARGERASSGAGSPRKLNGAPRPDRAVRAARAASRRSTSAGQPFHDPEADAALFEALREGVDRATVEVHEVDADINDPAFADRDGRPAARADPGGGVMTRDEALDAAARAGRRRAARSSAPAPAPACRPSAPRPAAST